MATFAARTLLDQVPAQVPDIGPSWLVELRRSAAENLRRRGFPHGKVEAWRFTPVRPVTSVPFVAVAGGAPVSDQWLAGRLGGEDGTWRVVVHNGTPHWGAPAPAGIEVFSLKTALGDAPGLVERHLGQHASREYFAALNALLFSDCVVIRVAAGQAVDRPVHIVYVASAGAEPSAGYPRVLVVAEARSQARLIETYVQAPVKKAQLTNAVTEVVLDGDSQLDHLRVHEGTPWSHHVGELAVEQNRGSRYASRVVALGGAFYRLDLGVALAGEGAECQLDGVYHVDGKELVDHHTVIEHVKPRCSSRERYRGIVAGRGHAIFDGTIFVRRDAQKSSAHQENRNLLLSDEATVHSKPHLGIDADDVVCSHGATVGALDEEQLYYLRSRGIGAPQARAALTYGFVQSLLDEIPHTAARRRLGAAVRARLPDGRAIEELLHE